MTVIELENKLYPKILKNIKKVPKKLYINGNLDILNSNCIAIVGSRKNTKYGEKWCKKFAQEFVKYNLTIVSGMALGIDKIAHKTAIKNGGKTIAVLPSGLENIYPEENLELYNEIILNLSNDINLLERWNKYRKEHTYAKEVEFEDTIKAIEKIHKIL